MSASDATKLLKTLEQQIQELWASRGLEVVQEEVWPEVHNGAKVFVWKITAKEAKKRESRAGRLAIFKAGTIYVGDSLLMSFLAPYEGKEIKMEVSEL